MIPLFIITGIEPVFGFTVESPAEVVVVYPEMTMISFSDSMYPDSIRIQKVRWEEVQGTPVARYDAPLGAVERASVQSKSTDRTDPAGRVTIVTVHTVRTPDNRNLAAQDHIHWTDRSGQLRVLTVEAGSTPKGIGDVQYLTECVETV